MALKQILITRKISELEVQKKELLENIANTVQRRAEWKIREADAEQALEEIDENTSDIIFIIIDRYSFFSLDVSAIKRSFAQNNEQEDFVMDNNNVNNDAIAARRRALAEALRQGEPVVVTPTGEVGTKDEMQENGLSGIQVPDGKLAKED